MDLSQALEIASHTDPGMVRSHNEDSIASIPDKGLVVLADGMGGYNAGEVASGMATTVLTTELRQLIGEHAPYEVDPQSGQKAALKMLQTQIAKANTSIYQASQSQPQYAGMGTTLVVALFYDNKMMVAHIGDSRLYRMRGDEFSQVSKDHSLLQEQIDAGMLTKEQASIHRTRIWSRGHWASMPRWKRRSTNTTPSRATSICCAPTGCPTWWATRISA